MTKGYKKLGEQYPDIGQVEVPYARHLLKRKADDKKALSILKKYAATSRFKDEVEGIWLYALTKLPISNSTEQQYQSYLALYPLSSKGKVQYKDFQKDLNIHKQLLADPAYRAWLKGDKLLEKNEFSAAKPLLLSALKGRPTDSAVMRSLGILYLRTSENELAYKYFLQAQQFTNDFNERAILKDLANVAKFWLYIRQAKQAIVDKKYDIAKQKLTLADALQQDPDVVLYNTGALFFAQGFYTKAKVIYSQILKKDSLNTSALFGLLQIAEAKQSEQTLQSFYNSLTFAQKKQIRESYSASLGAILRQRANKYSAIGDINSAQETLKNAINQVPEQPWLYYDLALIYKQKGLTEKARSLFKNALLKYPLNYSLYYSHALFLRSLDDFQGALDTLNQIPEKARDESITTLAQQLRLNESLAQSDKYINSTDRKATINYLTNLEAQPLTPLMQADLSRSWYSINENKHAVDLLKKALLADPSLSAYWHMLYGQWLLDEADEKATKQWFSQYILPKTPSESEISQYVQLQSNVINKYYPENDLITTLNQLDQKYKNSPAITTALINANLAQGQRDSAIILYQQKAKNNQNIEPQSLIAIAQAYVDLGNSEQAKKVMKQAIVKTPAEQSYLLRQMMSSLSQFNNTNDAMTLAKQLIQKLPNDQELYYLAAQIAEKANDDSQAKAWYKQALSPNKVLDDEQLYSRFINGDNEPWYISGAKRQLINQQNKNRSYIAIGVNFSGQTSTESDATLGAGIVPIEAYFKLWQGQGFIKLDPTTISAQTTRFDEQYAGSRYGQGALCIFICSIEQVTPEETGIDVGLGWQNENWRFDIGTTPLGFLVEDIVWGINYKSSLGDFGYGVELEKRPVTNSVLSYAGLKDVNTGKVWGGVRSTGFTLNLSHDLGGDWGYWSSADFQLYKGLNVKDNQRYRLMAGSYYRVISNENRVFTVGANLLHWAYQYNLSEETWGHGGYYSPQNYAGLSIPLSYDARLGNDFIYQIKTGVSLSKTNTQAIDFFPNDENLQNQAFVSQVQTGVTPSFESDSSSAISYNLGASFEYRVTPHWFFGGYFSIDRSEFYQPNFGQLYIRYNFSPVYGTLEFPGKPITPYADF